MGYTHYWKQKRNFSKDEWSSLVNDVKKVFDSLPQEKVYAAGHGFFMKTKLVTPEICGVWSKNLPPVLTDEEIVFVDKRDQWRTQVFRLNRTEEILGPQNRLEDGEFCCKTNLEGYDMVVCAVLILAAFRGKDAIAISSDGLFGQEWLRAFDCIERRVLPSWNQKDADEFAAAKKRLIGQDMERGER